MPSFLFKTNQIYVVIKNWIGFKKNQICFWELKKSGFFFMKEKSNLFLRTNKFGFLMKKKSVMFLRTKKIGFFLERKIRSVFVSKKRKKIFWEEDFIQENKSMLHALNTQTKLFMIPFYSKSAMFKNIRSTPKENVYQFFK